MLLRHFNLIIFFFIISNGLFGQVQIGQDIDGNGVYNSLGYSVSMSSNGNRVAIGTPNSDENGGSSGHIEIHEYQNNTWIQVGNNISGEGANDFGGYSVSLSSDGNIVALGAPQAGGNGTQSGQVRVYEWDNTNWEQLGNVIYGAMPYDAAGASVALSSDGTIVAVGSTGYDGSSINIGQVRVFQLVGSNWVQLGQDINGEGEEDFSSYSLSISSNGFTVAIGSRVNNGFGTDSGHVRVYEFLSNEWVQIGQDINGEFPNDRSGTSVALSGNGDIVAIGAPLNDGNGDASGHTRIFKIENNEWLQLGQDINGAESLDIFGTSVDLSDNGLTLVVGASLNDSNGPNSGHARIFYYNINNNEWAQIGQDIIGEFPFDKSGSAISISSNGEYVIITAPDNDGNGTLTGHARVFSIPNPCLPSTSISVVQACNSYIWLDGNTYTSNNSTATYITTNSDGCDSIITLDLTINNSTNSTDVITVCDSYTWLDGNTYTSSNSTATFTTTNSVGCDSIITLELTINSSTNSTDVITTCDSYTWLDGVTYMTNNNTATFTTINSVGCDSIITLDLTINNSTSSIDEITACDSYTWLDGNTYTASNDIATFTTVNSLGCDSLITLNLIINVADTSVTENGSILSANASNATYQWFDCDSNENISGATDQNFTPSSSGSFAVEVTQDGCVATSSCYDVIVTNLKEHSEVVDLKLFPNPVKAGEFISIELPIIPTNEEWEIQILNSTGKLVEKKKSSGNAVSIQAPTTIGNYTIQAQNEDGFIYIGKLIVIN